MQDITLTIKIENEKTQARVNELQLKGVNMTEYIKTLLNMPCSTDIEKIHTDLNTCVQLMYCLFKDIDDCMFDLPNEGIDGTPSRLYTLACKLQDDLKTLRDGVWQLFEAKQEQECMN